MNGGFVVRRATPADAGALVDLARVVVAEPEGWLISDGGWRSVAEIPAETDESRALSRDLKRRGFRFVGPTICYALMQSAGLVDDHVVDCFRSRKHDA